MVYKGAALTDLASASVSKAIGCRYEGVEMVGHDTATEQAVLTILSRGIHE
jgi:hypothetical protein